MKKPKKIQRYCPSCRKKQEHKVIEVSTGFKRGTLSRGGQSRLKARGLNKGKGNQGRFSKKPPAQQKRKSKTTKKTNIVYQCMSCKKKHYQKKGKRTSKLIIE